MSWSVGGVTHEQKTKNPPRRLGRSTLMYVTAGVSDDEIFMCKVVDDLGGVLARSRTIHVIDKQRIDVSPENRIAPTGTDVLLRCSVCNRVGNLTWFKGNDLLMAVNNSPLETPYHLANGRYSLCGDVSDGEYDLCISKVQIEDEGLYHCEIGPTEYQDGVKSGTAQLMIIEQPSDVQIVSADTFLNRSLTVGNPVSLMCVARNANPPVQILWYMDDEQIRENVRTEIESSSRRRLYNTKSRITVTPTYHNAGSNLTCEARSDALEYKDRKVIQLNNIQYKPVVTIIVRPQHPTEGDDVSVTCHVDANPSYTNVTFACKKGKEVQVQEGWLELHFKDIEPEANDIECICTASNEHGSGQISTNVHVSPDNKKRSLRILFYTIVPVAILMVILPLVTFKYRREIRILQHRLCSTWTSIDEEQWKYDAFVCYRSESGCSSPEESFVIREMLPRLENDHGFRLCIHCRDFQVGAAIMDNILNAIQNSSRTILVLSPSFVLSEWCRFEYEKAQAEMLRIGTKIIPIMFEDITRLDDIDPSLKSLLNVVTYLKWPGEAGSREEKDKFWQSLIEAMPKNTRRGEADDEDEPVLIV
ncbi:kin of IRRE-like protein 1 [Ptychodera flava]|uniref:kin of IRRE-like protein 1 n=1 Tax=Ptychodera flava TaxID=63121 RepID=UPI00396A355C